MSVLLKNLYFNGKPANKVILNGEVIHTGANKLIFSVDTDSISFGKEGGVSSVTITANENWVMTVPSWLTASTTSGSSTTTVSISAGVATEGKSGNIVITCSGKEHIITAEQVVVNYFRITNRTGNSGTITLTKAGTSHDIVLRTRTNGGEWSQPVTYSATSTISLPANGYVEFDGSANAYWSNSDNYRWQIQANVNHDVSGDIMTLISGSSLGAYEFASIFIGNTNLANASGLTLSATTLASYCYQYMFRGCTSLTTAPSLPATTLADHCYRGMFRGCTSLTAAPVLPATTLRNSCYQYMFYGCTSLTTAPELPATTLADDCYQYMFYGCTALNYIKCLATDISANSCTGMWTYGVASTGTFVKASSMSTWTTGVNGIPSGWTVEDNIDPGE